MSNKLKLGEVDTRSYYVGLRNTIRIPAQAAAAAGTEWIFLFNGAGNQTSNTGDNATRGMFVLDPAELQTVAGLSKYVNLRCILMVNDTAPGVTFTVRLRAVTNGGGGVAAAKLTLGAEIASVVYTTPAANSTTTTYSGDIAFPAMGAFALTLDQSGATAANSVSSFTAAVLTRNAP